MTDGHQPTWALRPEVDAYGQAALALVESLIHELKARSVLTAGSVLTVVEVAHEAQRAIADDMPAARAARAATELLKNLIVSLRGDLVRD